MKNNNANKTMVKLSPKTTKTLAQKGFINGLDVINNTITLGLYNIIIDDLKELTSDLECNVERVDK